LRLKPPEESPAYSRVKSAGGADFAILFGIGIAIDIGSSDLRNPFRP
jgi:hypothetical protein